MDGDAFAEIGGDLGERADVVLVVDADGEVMRDAPFEFLRLAFAPSSRAMRATSAAP
jgi:hypothetical protein